MAEHDRNPFAQDQLKREAADWFLKMQEPDAEQRHRPAFDQWLARGAMHRAAYNRIANLYLTSENVDWINLPPAQPVRGTMRRTTFAIIGLAMLVSFLVWKLMFSPMGTSGPELAASPAPGRDMVAAQLVTRLGEIRAVRLADGSRLTLDTDTLVTVDFRKAMRMLRVEHGRARFDVAHEPRPFIVDAGESEVVAHGTTFDVSVLERDTVHVHLLRGSVEVRRSELASGRRGPALAWLRPGEGVSIADRDPAAVPVKPVREAVADWPSGSVDFKAATLGDVVRMANRYSATKIRLGDRQMAAIPVSGVFRVTDADKLATSLALLLNLQLARKPGEIVLMIPEK